MNPEHVQASPSQPVITPELIVEHFKRAGYFDSLRKAVLEDYQASSRGKDLQAQLQRILETEGRNAYNSQRSLAPGVPDAVMSGLQSTILPMMMGASLLRDIKNDFRSHLASSEYRHRIRNSVAEIIEKIKEDSRKEYLEKSENENRERRAKLAGESSNGEPLAVTEALNSTENAEQQSKAEVSNMNSVSQSTPRPQSFVVKHEDESSTKSNTQDVQMGGTDNVHNKPPEAVQHAVNPACDDTASTMSLRHDADSDDDEEEGQLDEDASLADVSEMVSRNTHQDTATINDTAQSNMVADNTAMDGKDDGELMDSEVVSMEESDTAEEGEEVQVNRERVDVDGLKEAEMESDVVSMEESEEEAEQQQQAHRDKIDVDDIKETEEESDEEGTDDSDETDDTEDAENALLESDNVVVGDDEADEESTGDDDKEEDEEVEDEENAESNVIYEDENVDDDEDEIQDNKDEDEETNALVLDDLHEDNLDDSQQSLPSDEPRRTKRRPASLGSITPAKRSRFMKISEIGAVSKQSAVKKRDAKRLTRSATTSAAPSPVLRGRKRLRKSDSEDSIANAKLTRESSKSKATSLSNTRKAASTASTSTPKSTKSKEPKSTSSPSSRRSRASSTEPKSKRSRASSPEPKDKKSRASSVEPKSRKSRASSPESKSKKSKKALTPDPKTRKSRASSPEPKPRKSRASSAEPRPKKPSATTPDPKTKKSKVSLPETKHKRSRASSPEPTKSSRVQKSKSVSPPPNRSAKPAKSPNSSGTATPTTKQASRAQSSTSKPKSTTSQKSGRRSIGKQQAVASSPQPQNDEDDTAASTGKRSRKSLGQDKDLGEDRDQSATPYAIGSKVAAFVPADDSDSDDNENDQDSDGPRESCIQGIIEKYSTKTKLYSVTECTQGSSNSQSIWKLPHHKIVDLDYVAKRKRQYKAGDSVFSLYQDDDDEESAKYYPAEIVRVYKTGVGIGVRFEDGETKKASLDEVFSPSDIMDEPGVDAQELSNSRSL